MTFLPVLDAALAGTQRQSPPVSLAGPDVTPERRLLQAASYEGLRRLAGQLPEAPLPAAALEPAPLDSAPVVSAAAAARLADILVARPGLLAEWLVLAARARLRVPPILLPDLLDTVTTRRELLETLEAVGGARLQWLAGLNPEWQFAAHLDPVAAFESGARADRQRALRMLRRADPVAASALLAEHWATESASERGSLLEVLRPDLGPFDEPLLERALHDSRKEVRALATDLLRRLPDSAFSGRWAARVRGLVQINQRVHVREPRALAGDWAADGADPRPPRGIGPTAWWLLQALALSPPDLWPVDALPALLAHELSTPLVAGISQAAAAYASSAWAHTLIVAWGEARTTNRQLPIDARRLFEALDAATIERTLHWLLQNYPSVAPALASSWPTAAWSPAFSRWFVGRLPVLLTTWSYAASEPLNRAALRLDPAVAPAVRALRTGLADHGWGISAVDRLGDTLEYRHALQTELA